MTQTATGRFDITLTPLEGVAGISRYTIDKIFHGDMTGTSAGEMLAVRTPTPGSAGYVLIERVTAALAGRRGAFMLQHHGLMGRGQPALAITIVPDSGSDDLAGITGTMTIDAAADHAYVLTYDLPDSP